MNTVRIFELSRDGEQPYTHKCLILNEIVQKGLFFKILFLYFQKEGEGGRKGRSMDAGEIQQSVSPHTSPSEDLARNPGTCPDWDSNQRPFASQASAQPTEPHQPGPKF